MKIKISKKALNELVDILDDILHSNPSQKLDLDDFLIRVSVLPFYTEKTLQKKEEVLKKFIQRLDEESISKFDEFNKRYLEWLSHYYPEFLDKYHLVVDFQKEYTDFEEDAFFDFESEEVDNCINEMHYEDEDKISAEEFMNEYGVDEDLIEDIQIYLKEFYNISLFHPTLDEEYLEDVIRLLSKFVYILELSVEFKDLAKALKQLEETLTILNLNKLDDDKKIIIKTLIESVFSDLRKWVEEVLISQTAKDIHYLDASLLASIAQIQMIIKGEENGNQNL